MQESVIMLMCKTMNDFPHHKLAYVVATRSNYRFPADTTLEAKSTRRAGLEFPYDPAESFKKEEYDPEKHIAYISFDPEGMVLTINSKLFGETPEDIEAVAHGQMGAWAYLAKKKTRVAALVR